MFRAARLKPHEERLDSHVAEAAAGLVVVRRGQDARLEEPQQRHRRVHVVLAEEESLIREDAKVDGADLCDQPLLRVGDRPSMPSECADRT